MSQEIWKDIPWYEWLYQVSSLGNVKSLKSWSRGKWWIKILTPLRSKGYLTIKISQNNKSKKYLIHRLVCITFLSNVENKKEVNHINWIKDDNRLENLEWCTRSENIKHNYKELWFISAFHINNPKPSLWKFWKDNILSKRVNQYDLDWHFIKTWECMSDIRRELWFNISKISSCCNWKQKSSKWFKWNFNNNI